MSTDAEILAAAQAVSDAQDAYNAAVQASADAAAAVQSAINARNAADNEVVIARDTLATAQADLIVAVTGPEHS